MKLMKYGADSQKLQIKKWAINKNKHPPTAEEPVANIIIIPPMDSQQIKQVQIDYDLSIVVVCAKFSGSVGAKCDILGEFQVRVSHITVLKDASSCWTAVLSFC